jgi:hypothetical protein
MTTMAFARTTEAKGRNGWFVLDHAEFFGDGKRRRWLDLCSKKVGKSAPISLRFAAPDDMRTLGRALLEAAEAFAAARDPLDAQVKAEYRALAEALRKDGELEFDPDCVVSLSEDGGAYVQSWSWVDGPVPSEDDADMQGPAPDADPQTFLDYWHQGHADGHWSSMHGCHEQCPVCQQEETDGQ